MALLKTTIGLGNSIQRDIKRRNTIKDKLTKRQDLFNLAIKNELKRTTTPCILDMHYILVSFQKIALLWVLLLLELI